MLGDQDIIEAIFAGLITIEPCVSAQLQPASYDVRLGPILLVPGDPAKTVIPGNKGTYPKFEEYYFLERGSGYILKPGKSVLGALRENVELQPSISAKIEGKSSLGRLGLSIHQTAGWVDPGWSGHLTLEISNHSHWQIVLFEGMKIAQLRFHRLEHPATRPYGHPELGSKYKDANGPQSSRYAGD